jgi:hypothetical protein
MPISNEKKKFEPEGRPKSYPALQEIEEQQRLGEGSRPRLFPFFAARSLSHRVSPDFIRKLPHVRDTLWVQVGHG